jgi:hypothetical protein
VEKQHKLKFGVWKELEATDVKNGFTWNPHQGFIKTGGYALEVFPEARQIKEKDITPTDIVWFWAEWKFLLEQYPFLCIGGWGKELNITAVCPDLGLAMEVARDLDQKAIFCLDTNETIDIGGQGKEPAFPLYLLSHRLQNLGLIDEEEK